MSVLQNPKCQFYITKPNLKKDMKEKDAKEKRRERNTKTKKEGKGSSASSSGSTKEL